MKIKKCDRCGEIINYKETEAPSLAKAFENIGKSITEAVCFMTGVKIYSVYAGKEPADLCPACENSFKQWMAYGLKIKKIKETVTPDEIIRDGKRYKLEKETEPEEKPETEGHAEDLKFGEF